MNRVEVRSLIELVPVMQAFLDGKPIQVACKPSEVDPYFEPKWETYTGDCPYFNNGNLMWRIKPEPREFWIVKLQGGGFVHESESAASCTLSNCIKGFTKAELIHVREVV